MNNNNYKTEADVQTQIRLALADTCVLTRTPAGLYWQGKRNGNTLTNIRPVKVTATGWPDLTGFRRSDGKAVYIECKRPSGGRRSEQQKKFIALAQASGCLAGFARSVDEARKIVEE